MGVIQRTKKRESLVFWGRRIGIRCINIIVSSQSPSETFFILRQIIFYYWQFFSKWIKIDRKHKKYRGKYPAPLDVLWWQNVKQHTSPQEPWGSDVQGISAVLSNPGPQRQQKAPNKKSNITQNVEEQTETLSSSNGSPSNLCLLSPAHAVTPDASAFWGLSPKGRSCFSPSRKLQVRSELIVRNKGISTGMRGWARYLIFKTRSFIFLKKECKWWGGFCYYNK